jgi:phosphoglycerate dehydrogenase-like enzyme
MKAVLHYRAGPQFRDRLEAWRAQGIDVAVIDETDTIGWTRELHDADVLLHVLAPVTAAMLDEAPRLRLIQKIGVGVNTIDRAAAAARGIVVANMPGSNSQAVAELALALLLAVLRRVVDLDRATRAGIGWQLDPAEVERAGEIGGKTVGLIGYGEIPRRLAPVFRALGAEVIYTRRSAGGDPAQCALPELLARADIVSLHVPLDATTRHLLDRAALARLRPGAIILNTARGELIDEAALTDALRSGHVRGAGLDVFATEPAKASPLFALPNVVLSPHLGWYTQETLARSLDIALENCRRIGAGEPLLHEVRTSPT